MARVTVEDCIGSVDNLFQLVLVSSKRARQIYAGSEPRVPLDGDKPTVIALREIAAGEVGREILDEKAGLGEGEPAETGEAAADAGPGDATPGEAVAATEPKPE